MNKGFWMSKGGGLLADMDAACDNPLIGEHKRSHQCVADATEPEAFSNKKQAVQASKSKLTAGMVNASPPPWEGASSFSLVQNQFMDRLFGDETNRPFSFSEENITSDGMDDPNMRKKSVNDHFGIDSSMGLSTSHKVENPKTCLSYGGVRKVKVNHVKDSDNGLQAPEEHNCGTFIGQAYNRGNETSFIPMGQGYSKEDESLMLMGHTYDKGEGDIRSVGCVSDYGDHNGMSIGRPYNERGNDSMSFGGSHEEPVFEPLAQPLNNYQLIYDQCGSQTSQTPDKNLDASTVSAVVNVSQVPKSRSETVTKNKSELKATRKEAPNSFPSNVRSLISTGMLDGVPVQYISVSREELRGVIKGSGYLCGCQSCNYSKVLNAYEFERHAGCKTKHPNNHIYFESGKTIYQIVQDLRNTPESQLFDAIQTVTGSPINQKSFRSWKESFQAATRELQRIYGKEELNL